MSHALSLPHEHGGYLTIVGATAAGVAVGHTHAEALAVGAVIAAAFFARAPVEALARGRGARFDAAAAALFALHQRATWFETLGMAALGTSSGLIAMAGHAEPRVALGVAVVIGVHTGLAVPLVRSEVRPRERARSRRAARIALMVLPLAALVLVLLGDGRFAVALVSRTLHAVVRARWPSAHAHPNVVGVRESALLALIIAAVAVCLH